MRGIGASMRREKKGSDRAVCLHDSVAQVASVGGRPALLHRRARIALGLTLTARQNLSEASRARCSSIRHAATPEGADELFSGLGQSSGRNSWIETPVNRATSCAQVAGTRFHLPTAWEVIGFPELVSRRANATGPPTACFAFSTASMQQ